MYGNIKQSAKWRQKFMLLVVLNIHAYVIRELNMQTYFLLDHIIT